MQNAFVDKKKSYPNISIKGYDLPEYLVLNAIFLIKSIILPKQVKNMDQLMKFLYLSHVWKRYSLNVHVQPSSGTRALKLCLNSHLCHYIVSKSSEGSSKTALLCKLN